MNKHLQVFIGFITFFQVVATVAAQPLVMQTGEVAVVYEAPLENVAGEVVRIYPKLKQQLEEFFGWGIDFKPQIALVNNTRTFQNMTRNNLFVAFAVPDKGLIVIDYTRMNIRPFNLSITLKHELCHLLLHRQISSHNLPKWLDEGVCQWVSDGIGEIFVNKGWSGLDAAVMAGRIIPFRRLENKFPRDGASLILAYEQSKSLINFIDRKFGYNAIMDILDLLKNGESVDTALMSRLGFSLNQLEKEWLDQLESTPRWLVFLASHIYAIVFFIASLLSILGFIRMIIKRKRKYEEWDEEDE